MSIDDEVRAALDTFVSEARDLLQDMEEGLLGLEDDPSATDTVNAIFRAVHTLKGSSGLFGLDHLVRFTHVLETLLDSVRDGRLDVTHDLVSALLPCTDHISTLVEEVASGTFDTGAAVVETGARLLTDLAPFLTDDDDDGGDGDGDGAGRAGGRAGTGDEGRGGEPAPVAATWQLSLRFGPDCLRNGMDPLAFLRYLSTIGAVTEVRTLTDALPDAEAMDPETCYLGFEAELVTSASKTEIEAVFDFVRDDSEIRILPSDHHVESYVKQIQGQPSSERIGDILVRSGAVTELEMARAVQIQQQRARVGGTVLVPIGEILVEEQIVQRPVVEAAVSKQRKTGETRAPDTQSIRVDATRLDKLIDLVGELVIAQASVGVRASSGEMTSLLEAQGEVMRLVEEVRHSALSLRMVPIGTTLRRFERVVRDVGVDLDKEVNLVVTGGDAEMDKALVERIGDPLLHLVRNALDHGIEPRGERALLGKAPRGTLRLNAYHDAGCIVIEVADDGRGLDRDRILAKAVERGLVEPGATLNDQDVYDLIFEPGFSTAATISNLSGRGVGMDVVRRNVMALRGSTEVETTLGVGTTIRIRLPLTLAIIDGFLVGVGTSSFVIPLDRVTECVELTGESAGRDCTSLRGEVLPLIRLRSLFDIGEAPPRRQNVVVVEESGQRTGLVVDALLGQFQTVIKPLGELFGHVKCIGGATILGNGEVALILDVGPLVADHTERERHLELVGAGAGG